METGFDYFLTQQDFLSFDVAVFLVQQDSFLVFSFLAAGLVSCAFAPIVNKAIAKTVNNFFIFINLIVVLFVEDLLAKYNKI